MGCATAACCTPLCCARAELCALLDPRGLAVPAAQLGSSAVALCRQAARGLTPALPPLVSFERALQALDTPMWESM